MNQPDFDTDVLIAGAGPTGLLLAAGLLRQGLKVRLVDKALAPSPLSRAIAVHARSLEMLDDFGLADELIASGTPISDFNLFAGGQRLVQLSMDSLDGPYPFILGVPQSETEARLRAYLTSYGQDIDQATELLSLSQTPTGVNAELCGPHGETFALRARWLVGCDGAHSLVRKAIGISFEGASYDESFLLADVMIDWQPAQLSNQAFAFLHEQGPLLIFPLKGSRYRVIAASPNRDLPRGYAPELAEVQTIASERSLMDLRLHDPVWLGSFKIHHRHAGSLRAGRVLLAGDAAHIHSPVGGQGMNTSMQDAYNLGWKLGLVVRELATESLLDSYEHERLAVARQLVRDTDRATRAVTLRHPVAQNLRNAVISLLGQRELVREKMRNTASELAIHYPASPLNHELWDRFGGGVRAGDRMPDFKLSDGRHNLRLFDLLRGPHHSLFLTGTGGHLTEIQARIQDLFQEHIRTFWLGRAPETGKSMTVYQDPEEALSKRLGIRAGCEAFYLVRPDGYIGCRSLPASWHELMVYLQKVFVFTRA